MNHLVQGTSLLGGRYETTTDVQALLNLALDAADMRESDQLNQKQDIYENVSLSSFWIFFICRSW